MTTPTDNAASNTTQAAEGGGNWFKNWFNSAGAIGAGQQLRRQVTASIDKAEAPPRLRQAACGRRALPAPGRARPRSMPRPAPAEVRARQRRRGRREAEGKYRVQLATVRTQQEAAALAAKAKRELAGALAAREPEIDQAVLGNMGSFYRVRVGPFATVQETQAVCAKVKGTGFDCMTVTQ